MIEGGHYKEQLPVLHYPATQLCSTLGQEPELHIWVSEFQVN